jgi:hypothetical protein
MSKASQPELKKVLSLSTPSKYTFRADSFLFFLVYGQKIVRTFARRPQGQRDVTRLRPLPQLGYR